MRVVITAAYKYAYDFNDEKGKPVKGIKCVIHGFKTTTSQREEMTGRETFEYRASKDMVEVIAANLKQAKLTPLVAEIELDEQGGRLIVANYTPEGMFGREYIFGPDGSLVKVPTNKPAPAQT